MELSVLELFSDERQKTPTYDKNTLKQDLSQSRLQGFCIIIIFATLFQGTQEQLVTCPRSHMGLGRAGT